MLYPWNYVNKIINRIIWVTQKNTEAEENRALKKEELKEKIRRSNSPKMDYIKKVKSISIWIFIVPFISVNVCLIIITKFHQILAPGVPIHSS